MCLTTEEIKELPRLVPFASWLRLSLVSSARALQGRLVLTAHRCTEAEGSTVPGPHWDKYTGGGTQPLSPHMIPLQPDTPSVYLVRCLLLHGYKFSASDRMIDRGVAGDFRKRRTCVLCRWTWQDIR